jgi:hypothetical protein
VILLESFWIAPRPEVDSAKVGQHRRRNWIGGQSQVHLGDGLIETSPLADIQTSPVMRGHETRFKLMAR